MVEGGDEIWMDEFLKIYLDVCFGLGSFLLKVSREYEKPLFSQNWFV